MMYALYVIFAVLNITVFTFTEDLINGIFAILFAIFIVEHRVTKAIEEGR